MMNNLDKFYNKNPQEFASSYLQYLISIIEGISTGQVAEFIKILLEARERDASIFFIGNGGSAATASHFANDLSIGTNSYEKPFKAVSLTDNNAIITAIGNDFGYKEIFLKQLQVLGKKGDVLVAISASGNSENLISALEEAKNMSILTVGITSFDGGKVSRIVDAIVHIPTEKGEYGPAEDCHMIIDHLVGSYLLRFIRNAIS